MKKTYIIPEMEVLQMAAQSIIATSDPSGHDTPGSGEELVKENVTSGQDNYNVWDDDWQK